MANGSDDGSTYQVGYGKPPKHSQFKKGQSGNPKGRPKKKSRQPQAVDVTDVLAEPVEIVDVNGRRKQVSSAEAMYRRQLQKGIEGDFRSLKAIITAFHEQGYLTDGDPEIGGTVEIPNSMPIAMGSMLLGAYGHPPWTRQQIEQFAAYYVSQLTEEERRRDRAWRYEDLKGHL